MADHDKQPTLFPVRTNGRHLTNRLRAGIPPIAAPIADQPRLGAQNRRILDLLSAGPATNVQLAEIALKYTSRISDIRRHLELSGQTIICRKLDGQPHGGLRVYTIEQLRHSGE